MASSYIFLIHDSLSSQVMSSAGLRYAITGLHCRVYAASLSAAASTDSSYKVVSMQVWPALAEWFGIELAAPLKTPLRSFMPKLETSWKQVREKYALKDIPYDKVHTSEVQSNSQKNVIRKSLHCAPILFWQAQLTLLSACSLHRQNLGR